MKRTKEKESKKLDILKEKSVILSNEQIKQIYGGAFIPGGPGGGGPTGPKWLKSDLI